VFQYLIETLDCDINVQDRDKTTPLMFALLFFKDGNITVLTYLLNQKNVDLNFKRQNGHTLLHLACQKINRLPLEIFELLIETHGADVNVQDDNNDTPLHNALRDFNLRNGGNITVLTYLLSRGNLNCNIKDIYGHTLLHYACDKIQYLPIEIFKFLIETFGSDVNAQDDDNDTPIHRALYSSKPNTAVLTYLLNQKAVNLNIKGQNGHTLFHLACKHINKLTVDIFKLLIETLGADVNILNNHQGSPIYYAFLHFNPNKGGDITVLTYLINQTNVHLNINGQNSYTLLHLPCILSSENDEDEYRSDAELDAENDAIFSQIIELVAERCVQHVLDGETS
jgi:ankyrin repeat protein